MMMSVEFDLWSSDSTSNFNRKLRDDDKTTSGDCDSLSGYTKLSSYKLNSETAPSGFNKPDGYSQSESISLVDSSKLETNSIGNATSIGDSIFKADATDAYHIPYADSSLKINDLYNYLSCYKAGKEQTNDKNNVIELINIDNVCSKTVDSLYNIYWKLNDSEIKLFNAKIDPNVKKALSNLDFGSSSNTIDEPTIYEVSNLGLANNSSSYGLKTSGKFEQFNDNFRISSSSNLSTAMDTVDDVEYYSSTPQNYTQVLYKKLNGYFDKDLPILSSIVAMLGSSTGLIKNINEASSNKVIACDDNSTKHSVEYANFPNNLFNYSRECSASDVKTMVKQLIYKLNNIIDKTLRTTIDVATVKNLFVEGSGSEAKIAQWVVWSKFILNCPVLSVKNKDVNLFRNLAFISAETQLALDNRSTTDLSNSELPSLLSSFKAFGFKKSEVDSKFKSENISKAVFPNNQQKITDDGEFQVKNYLTQWGSTSSNAKEMSIDCKLLNITDDIKDDASSTKICTANAVNKQASSCEDVKFDDGEDSFVVTIDIPIGVRYKVGDLTYHGVDNYYFKQSETIASKQCYLLIAYNNGDSANTRQLVMSQNKLSSWNGGELYIGSDQHGGDNDFQVDDASKINTLLKTTLNINNKSDYGRDIIEEDYPRFTDYLGCGRYEPLDSSSITGTYLYHGCAAGYNEAWCSSFHGKITSGDYDEYGYSKDYDESLDANQFTSARSLKIKPYKLCGAIQSKSSITNCGCFGNCDEVYGKETSDLDCDHLECSSDGDGDDHCNAGRSTALTTDKTKRWFHVYDSKGKAIMLEDLSKAATRFQLPEVGLYRNDVIITIDKSVVEEYIYTALQAMMRKLTGDADGVIDNPLYCKINSITNGDKTLDGSTTFNLSSDYSLSYPKIKQTSTTISNSTVEDAYKAFSKGDLYDYYDIYNDDFNKSYKRLIDYVNYTHDSSDGLTDNFKKYLTDYADSSTDKPPVIKTVDDISTKVDSLPSFPVAEFKANCQLKYTVTTQSSGMWQTEVNKTEYQPVTMSQTIYFMNKATANDWVNYFSSFEFASKVVDEIISFAKAHDEIIALYNFDKSTMSSTIDKLL